MSERVFLDDFNAIPSTAQVEGRPAEVDSGRADHGPDDLHGWDEPVPLSTRGLTPCFPTDVLPDWLGEWAVAISAEKGASLDLSATLGLAVISGAIARNVQVVPRPGWYEPTNLHAIIALAPGQRKSPVFKAAFRPVRTIEAQRLGDYQEIAALADLAAKIAKKREREMIEEAADEADPNCLRERLETFIGEIGVSEAPARPRLLTEDTTPEALASLLADNGRIIAASDEGAALFENLSGRYTRGSTSWDVFNKAHSGVDLVVDRKSADPVIVYDPALTLAIATQPEMLRTLAAKPGAEGRGVLARPLYVLPTPVYAESATPEADRPLLTEYARRTKNVFIDTPELETDDEGHPRPTSLTFDERGQAAFEGFELELNRERRELACEDFDGDSVYLGWLSKLAGQTARIAAVLHCASHWTDGAGSNRVVVDHETVERAVILAGYYRAHARAVFGLMGELPLQKLTSSILRWLVEKSGAGLEVVTVRDIHRAQPAGTRAADVRSALSLLEQHGHLRIERSPPSARGGRPSDSVRLHPALVQDREVPDKTDTTPRSVSSVRLRGAYAASPVAGEHADLGRPFLGDARFLEWLWPRFVAGLITEEEWHIADRAHRFALGSESR